MRWYNFTTNDDHEIGSTVSGRVSINLVGTGDVQLGFKGPDGSFVAYTDSESALSGSGDGTVVFCGRGTQLMAQTSGVSGTLSIGVGTE